MFFCVIFYIFSLSEMLALVLFFPVENVDAASPHLCLTAKLRRKHHAATSLIPTPTLPIGGKMMAARCKCFCSGNDAATHTG